MLSGARAFDDEDLAETIGAVIHKDPAWDRLPATTPAMVRTVLQRCLQKDPKERIRDIGDVQLALKGAFDGPAQPAMGAAQQCPCRARSGARAAADGGAGGGRPHRARRGDVAAAASGSRHGESNSSAIQVGNRLYVAGITGNTPANKGDVKAQPAELLARGGRTLKAAGFDWSNVVDEVVYLPDMTTFAEPLVFPHGPADQ